jgi:hypothetical protein
MAILTLSMISHSLTHDWFYTGYRSKGDSSAVEMRISSRDRHVTVPMRSLSDKLSTNMHRTQIATQLMRLASYSGDKEFLWH